MISKERKILMPRINPCYHFSVAFASIAVQPWSVVSQDIAGRNFYRPRDSKIAAKYSKQFLPVKLVTIDEVFGGWQKAQKLHFSEAGVFDQIIVKK